jgi:hypothetical protein
MRTCQELADKAQAILKDRAQVADLKGVLIFSTLAVDNFVGNRPGNRLNR